MADSDAPSHPSAEHGEAAPPASGETPAGGIPAPEERAAAAETPPGTDLETEAGISPEAEAEDILEAAPAVQKNASKEEIEASPEKYDTAAGNPCRTEKETGKEADTGNSPKTDAEAVPEAAEAEQENVPEAEWESPGEEFAAALHTASGTDTAAEEAEAEAEISSEANTIPEAAEAERENDADTEAREPAAEADAPPAAFWDAHQNDGLPPAPADPEIRELRELVFSREIALIARLQAILENPQVTTRKISEVLPEAIHMRTAADPRLSMALEPVVDGIVKASLLTRRNDFVNALSPLMGPTIRKSIAESFRSMMGNFSKSVEMAFSWKGIRWRLQSLRSGRPFSEIVMLNTLVYRVEQLFFIHNGTGLVLAHLAGDSVESQDADMVSAMLTAIQDFVRDCFAAGRDEELHSLQMGEFTLHIESGTYAYLACVMRGTPPAGFHDQLRAALELMHIEYADALVNFDGDTEPFAGAVRYLESCMVSHYVTDDKKLPLWAKVLPLLVLLAALAGAGYLYHLREEAAERRAVQAERQETFMNAMRAAVGILRDEPGLMVANTAEAPQAPWHILVLQDPLARSPDQVLMQAGVDPAYFSFRIIPFVSYDPSIVVRRVEENVKPPDTVSMVFAEGRLTFTGTAPMSWIVSAREDARAIPGVEHVDVSGVHDPMMQQINAMIAEVENTVIEFPLGRDTPVAGDLPKLTKAIDTLVELENITKRMGFTASLTIYGHADAVGDPKRNYEISQSRARTVAGMLYAKGSSMPVAIYGMGADFPKDGQTGGGQSQASRRIELRVHFALSPSASPEMFRR